MTFIISWYPWYSGGADFGLLWTQVVVAIIVALIFVVATKGRLGFVAKEQTESERSTSLIANP